jgi:hypothetical protein
MNGMRGIGLLLALYACLWALSCAQARAEDYDALVAQALAAQESSDFERSHRLFSEAHTLAPNARTLRGMGVASYRAGAYVRAIAELEAALVHPDKPLSDELRGAVETLCRRALGRVGTLSLQVSPAEAQLAIDGTPVYGAERSRLLLEPGKRKLSLRAAGYEERLLELQVVAGMQQSLTVSLTPVSTAAATQVSESSSENADAGHLQAPRQPERARSSSLLRASYGLIGLSAVAGTTAGVLAGVAKARVTRIARACRETDSEACSPAQKRSALEDAQLRRFERAINALLGVGGAALAGAVTLLSLGLSRKRELAVALDAQGIRVSGAF